MGHWRSHEQAVHGNNQTRWSTVPNRRQQQADRKSKGNGSYIVCTACPHWEFSSGLAQDHIRCVKCRTLLPRQYLTNNAQLFWDNAAAAEAKEKPRPPLPSHAADQCMSSKAAEPEQIKPSFSDLKKEHSEITAFLRIATTFAPDMQLSIAGEIGKQKQRLAEVDQALSPDDEPPEHLIPDATRLTKELQRQFELSKAEDKRIEKHQAAIVQAQCAIRDAKAFILTCEQKAAIAHTCADISAQLSSITSGPLPETEKVEEDNSMEVEDPISSLWSDMLQKKEEAHQAQLQALSDQVTALLSPEAKQTLQAAAAANEASQKAARDEFERQLSTLKKLPKKPPPTVKKGALLKPKASSSVHASDTAANDAAEAIAKAAAIRADAEQAAAAAKDNAINVG